MNSPYYTTLGGTECPLFTYREDLAQRAAESLAGSLESGALVLLRRTDHEGNVTKELLSRRVAGWVLYSIPYCEPDVARAKIEHTT